MPTPALVPKNALQQLVNVLQAMGAQDRRQDKKVSPPIFKGQPQEKPDPHLLKTNDWLDNNRHYNMRNSVILDILWMMWLGNGMMTLLYQLIGMPCMYCVRHFSIQCRSIQHWHERRSNFKLNNHTDDIYVFISGVKQTAHQLNHNDIGILNLIEACIPADIFDTLYPVHEVDVAAAMLKDIYAKKPEPRAPTGTTPFSIHCSLKTKLQMSQGTSPRVTFSEAAFLTMQWTIFVKQCPN